MAIKTYLKTDTSYFSKNFKVSEFKCKCGKYCSEIKVDEKLVEYLQKIRDHFAVPIAINSAYRCKTHNKNVGGSTNSRHMKGEAADIVVKGIAPKEVAQYAESLGILGIGLYETAKDGYFVHVDTRTTKSFWYGQACEPRSTFSDAAPEDSKEPSQTTIYRVQVGAYSVKANADKMAAELKNKGYSVMVVKGEV
ncbi:MAG: DUF882 domain-containing protein [Ruminococcaceae bacterium]|nr:DUF882 domain-containing protein [Oscillospiraceae bacterium]